MGGSIVSGTSGSILFGMDGSIVSGMGGSVLLEYTSIAEQWRLFAEFGLAEYLPSNALEKLLVHQRYGDQPKLSKAAAMELLGIPS
jgi:hypothetical protein